MAPSLRNLPAASISEPLLESGRLPKEEEREFNKTFTYIWS